MIPMTMQTDASEPLWQRAGVGVLANAVILAAVLAIRAAIVRFRA